MMPVPPWLEPYAPHHDEARAALLTPEIPLFDSLWARACGDAQPALSKREQDVLINFLGGP
jgi:hypothetical protein